MVWRSTRGDLFIADTGVERSGGRAPARRHRAEPDGCDTTFGRNTLCLDNILVAHRTSRVPTHRLDREATSGFVNERNAIVL